MKPSSDNVEIAAFWLIQRVVRQIQNEALLLFGQRHRVCEILDTVDGYYSYCLSDRDLSEMMWRELLSQAGADGSTPLPKIPRDMICVSGSMVRSSAASKSVPELAHLFELWLALDTLFAESDWSGLVLHMEQFSERSSSSLFVGIERELRAAIEMHHVVDRMCCNSGSMDSISIVTDVFKRYRCYRSLELGFFSDEIHLAAFQLVRHAIKRIEHCASENLGQRHYVCQVLDLVDSYYSYYESADAITEMLWQELLALLEVDIFPKSVVPEEIVEVTGRLVRSAFLSEDVEWPEFPIILERWSEMDRLFIASNWEGLASYASLFSEEKLVPYFEGSAADFRGFVDASDYWLRRKEEWLMHKGVAAFKEEPDSISPAVQFLLNRGWKESESGWENQHGSIPSSTTKHLDSQALFCAKHFVTVMQMMLTWPAWETHTQIEVRRAIALVEKLIFYSLLGAHLPSIPLKREVVDGEREAEFDGEVELGSGAKLGRRSMAEALLIQRDWVETDKTWINGDLVIEKSLSAYDAEELSLDLFQHLLQELNGLNDDADARQNPDTTASRIIRMIDALAYLSLLGSKMPHWPHGKQI